MASVLNSPLVPIGTVKESSHLRCWITGIDPEKYTICGVGSEASIPTNGGQYRFNGTGSTIHFTRKGMIQLYKIRMYLDSTLVRTIKFWGGNIFWVTYDYLEMAYLGQVDVPMYEKLQYKSDLGNPYYYSGTESEIWGQLYSPGYHRIYLQVDLKVDGKGDILTDTFEVGYINVHDLVLNSIRLNVSNVTKKFYKNSPFNYNNLGVTSIYHYHSDIGGGYACELPVSNGYSVSSPNMSTVGDESITVTYGGKTASYNITVVGVSSVSENSSTKFRYLIDVSNPTPTALTINYTDGTSRQITSSIASNFAWTSGDLSAVGTRTLAYKIYDSNTGEWIANSSTKYVRDVASLSVKTNPTKLVYQTNESHSNNGLVVTANYGDAGTFDISKTSSPVNWTQGDISINTPNMTTVGIKTVAFSYRGKSTSYGITVHGITSVRLYVPESLNKHLRGDLVTSLTDGLRVFYTCSDQDETELPLSSTKVSVDTSGVNVGVNGTYNIRVTVTHEGNSITETYPVQVYSLESLAVNGYKSEFVHTGTAPTFSVGGLVVTAHFSDGSERELASNEYTVSSKISGSGLNVTVVPVLFVSHSPITVNLCSIFPPLLNFTSYILESL